MEGRNQQRRQWQLRLKFIIALFMGSLSLLMMAESGLQHWKVASPVPLKRGDLVFRRGHGLWTRYFINMSTRERRFSHVGIVASATNLVTIIHSEASDISGIGDVHISRWSDFFKDSTECAVFRYGKSAEAANAIAGMAERYKGTPFDSLFDMEETNKLYCSEMVRVAINEAVGTNLVGFTEVGGHRVVAIDDLYRNDFIRVYDSKQSQEITKKGLENGSN